MQTFTTPKTHRIGNSKITPGSQPGVIYVHGEEPFQMENNGMEKHRLKITEKKQKNINVFNKKTLAFLVKTC